MIVLITAASTMTWFCRYLSLVVLLTLGLAECHRLIAAAKSSHLKPRTLSFRPRYDGHTLRYGEGTFAELSITRKSIQLKKLMHLVTLVSYVPESAPPFAAEVNLDPKLPALVLEDVIEHLSLVACSSSQIMISFYSTLQMRRAEEAWRKNPEFLMILSQKGCSAAGTHQPHM